jgi:hypothetical protein
MPMLEDKIMNDYKQAMKEKNALKVSVLNFLRAQLKNLAIDKKQDKLPDTDVVVIIKKQIKQRQDSIAQFEKGGRNDLADKEKAELEILKTYLPEEMSEEEIGRIVEESIRECGASSMKDMGDVMKKVMSKVAGRADNKLVSDTVRKKLSQ